MRGQLEFGLNAFCDRCAEAVKAPIRHSFELGMAREAGPRRGRTQNESEKDEAPTEEMEALDLVFFHGNEMELDPIIEEQLLLSVPYQTLCKGDCKGICAECGKNLNEAPCECKKENKLSPFSKLKSLKK
jgi:uncharacterized protein